MGKLYHKDIFMKKQHIDYSYKFVCSHYFQYSNHLYRHLDDDTSKNRFFDCNDISFAFRMIKMYDIKPFEIETDDNDNPIKSAYRVPINSKSDLCMVLSLNDDRPIIKTCWTNSATDNHITLDTRNYENAEQ